MAWWNRATTADVIQGGAAGTGLTVQGNTFNGANKLIQADGTGKLPAIDGSQLTNLPDIQKLVTVAGVDLNVITKTNLYTVPAGKTAIITFVVVRSASLSLTLAQFGFGFNALADDVIAPSNHNELTTSTKTSKLDADAGAESGAAASVFGIKCTVAQGVATTCAVDVFGYTV